MHPEDAEDFEQIIQEYKAHPEIEFLHKGLIGAEWQKALAEIDVLLIHIPHQDICIIGVVCYLRQLAFRSQWWLAMILIQRSLTSLILV